MKLQLVVSAHLLVASAAFHLPQTQPRRLSPILRAKVEEEIVKNYNVLTPKRANYQFKKSFPSELEAPKGKLAPLPSPPVDPTPPPAQVPEPVVVVTEPPPVPQPLPPPVIEVPPTPPPQPEITAVVPQIPERVSSKVVEYHSTSANGGAGTNAYIERMRDNHDQFLKLFRDSPRSPGEAPTLSDYILKGGSGNSGESLSERLSHLKSLNYDALQDLKFQAKGWPALQDNIGKFTTDTERAIQESFQHIPADKIQSSFDGALQVLVTQGLSKQALQQMWEALNTKELGGWYAGVITVIVLGIVASSASSDEVAPVAETVSIDTTPLAAANTGASSVMESQVLQLSEATAAVSKELKELKMRLAERDYTVASLQSEFRIVQNELSNLKTVEKQLQSKVTSLKGELAAKTTELADEKARRDSVEAALRAQIESLGATVKKPELPSPAPEPVPVPEPMAVAVQEPKSVEKPVAKAKSAPKAPTKSKTATKAAPATKVAAKAATPKAAQKSPAPAPKSAPKAADAPKKAPAKKKSTPAPSVASVFFAATEEQAPTTSPGTAKKAAVPSPSAAKESMPSAPSSDSDDWSSLAASTLLRKTVTELSEYLVAKGASITGADGKKLKKAELVEAVLASS